MTKEAFARELGAYHWGKLERLAEHYEHKSSGKYAVTLLKHAIEEAEMWMRADLYSKHERLITDLEELDRRVWEEYLAESSGENGEYDDDIPF